MRLRALKVAMLTGLALLVTVAAGTVISTQAPTAEAELPEYVGSDACMGCHTSFYDRWDDSGHNHMFVQVMKPGDLPGPVDAVASPELKDELLKADWIVAGHRFVARNPNTGDMTYLNVQWDDAKQQYVSYKGGSNWTQNCAGCHTTGWNKSTATFADPGIGCEMCHGPGRDHILAKGDPAKITKSASSEVCGACHNAGSMADGTRWPEGFRPGMHLEDVGFTLKPWSADEPIPTAAMHLRQYQPWLASDHAKATADLKSNDHAGEHCYKCHSGEVLSATQHEETVDTHEVYDGVSCVACHSAHSLKLKKDEQTTCTQCHTAEIQPGATVKPGSTVHHPMKEMLEGYGAIGITPTKGAHSGEKCIDCHMTENNHAFKILKPSEVMGTNRKDTCTSCHAHENSSPESRGIYLDMMQEKVETTLTDIGVQVGAIDAALKADPAVLGDTLDAYKAARTNWTFVEADASKGAHNFEYAIKILADAQKAVQSAFARIPK